jgi:hypothetical protein
LATLLINATDIRSLVEAISRLRGVERQLHRERLLEPIQKAFAQHLRKGWLAQEKVLVRDLKRLPNPPQLQEAAPMSWDEESALERAVLETEEYMVSGANRYTGMALEKGAASLIDEFSLSMRFDLANPRATTWLREHSSTLIRGIDDATRTDIRAIITAGHENRLTYDQIAHQISDKYEQFRVGMPQAHIESRAHLVAVQESHVAYVEGNRQVADEMKDQGLEMVKMWLRGSDYDCDICGPNGEAGWIDIDDDFPSGDSQSPGHVACLCDTMFKAKATVGGE